MTTLSEQEEMAMFRARVNLPVESYGDIDQIKAFDTGFKAGLTYNKAKVIELENEVATLKSQLATMAFSVNALLHNQQY